MGTIPFVERFWSKVDKSGVCWVWTGAIVKGYGAIKVDGKMKRAHRVSYELAYGPIPDEVDVLHSCDCPPCVRPSHLFKGDDTDNARDRTEKGRGRGQFDKGASHPNARLTADEVRAIREMRAAGASLSEIAQAFEISDRTASAICQRTRWSHIT